MCAKKSAKRQDIALTRIWSFQSCDLKLDCPWCFSTSGLDAKLWIFQTYHLATFSRQNALFLKKQLISKFAFSAHDCTFKHVYSAILRNYFPKMVLFGTILNKRP